MRLQLEGSLQLFDQTLRYQSRRDRRTLPNRPKKK
jgi:hypothetical protein